MLLLLPGTEEHGRGGQKGHLPSSTGLGWGSAKILVLVSLVSLWGLREETIPQYHSPSNAIVGILLSPSFTKPETTMFQALPPLVSLSLPLQSG